MSQKLEAARDRHAGMPVPPGNKHGPNTYARRAYMCECSVCLPSGKAGTKHGEGKTYRERDRKLRRDKAKQPVPATAKHGIYAYKVYQCKCSVCRAAMAAQRANQKHAWRKKARGRWVDGPKETVICWPPHDAGPDWVCPDPAHLEAS